jgi:hypothetical protein
MNGTTDTQPAARGVQPPEKVVIRVARRGTVEVFEHAFDRPLDALVDLYEGEVGTVLTVHGTTPPRRLHKALIEAWEAGVR